MSADPLHVRLRKLAVLVEQAPEVVDDVKAVVRQGRALLGLRLGARLKRTVDDLTAAERNSQESDE